ncbi:O-antigen ligase family protein [Natronococcus occultus]
MSLTNNPNTLAQILFAGTIASFVLSVRTDRRAYGVFTGICAVGLLATGSRASVLSAVVALAIYIVYTRGGQTYLRATLGLLAITIVSVLILLPSLNQFGIHVTFTGRVQLWTATMHAIAERPIVGYGLGDASEMINTFVDDPALQEFGPHNSYLRMTLHLGIFGGLSYLVLTGWVFLRHVTAKRIDVPFVAIGAGFAINQLFEDNMMFEPTIVSIVMTVVFGYLVADHLHLRRTYRQEHRNRRPIMRCDDSDTGLNTNGSMSSRSSSRTLVRPDPTSARYVAKPKPKRRTNRRSRRRYGRRVRRER